MAVNWKAIEHLPFKQQIEFVLGREGFAELVAKYKVDVMSAALDRAHGHIPTAAILIGMHPADFCRKGRELGIWKKRRAH